MIIMLSGENDFARYQASRQLRQAFAAKHGASAVSVRDAAALNMAELPQLLQGVSLFEPTRLLLLKDAGQNKAIWEALPELLPEDDATIVVLDETKPDKRTRTYKWLQKHADLRDFPLLNDGGVAAWLRSEAAQRGVELTPVLVQQLVARTGADQWLLSQALEKLALARRPVSEQLITELIEPNPQASAFALLDAALAGDATTVARLTNDLRQTEDAYRFSGLLTSQIYSLALAQAAGSRPAATLARDAGLHPFVAGKMLAAARNLTRTQLSGVIRVVLELDDTLKSTGGDPWLPLETALMKIASRRSVHK